MVSPVQRDYLASGPRGDGSAQYGDDVRHEMTLVADDRAFSVRVGSAQAPRSMTVTVVMDGRLSGPLTNRDGGRYRSAPLSIARISGQPEGLSCSHSDPTRAPN
jgi:hypothetical protein